MVVAKVECHAGGTNLRFVVTNLPSVAMAADCERVYDGYIQRGESEHRMDELADPVWRRSGNGSRALSSNQGMSLILH